MEENKRVLFNDRDRMFNDLDFMRYSLFGISEDDLISAKDNDERNDIIIKGSVDCAYKDAARHVLRRKKDECNEKEWNEKKNKAKEELKIWIKSLSNDSYDLDKENIPDTIKNELKNNFDRWHYNLTNKLCQIFEEDGSKGTFTIGIAQKWINMTIKYLMVFENSLFGEETVYWYENEEDAKEEKSEKVLNELFPKDLHHMITNYSCYFHIPIDGYILDALKKKMSDYVNSEDRNNRKDDKNRLSKGLDIKAEFDKWSQQTSYLEYIKLQNAVRSVKKEEETLFYDDPPYSFHPIDWEGMAWIAAARKMRNK